MEVEEESFSAYSVRAKGVFNTFFYSTTQPLVQKSVGRAFAGGRRGARACAGTKIVNCPGSPDAYPLATGVHRVALRLAHLRRAHAAFVLAAQLAAGSAQRRPTKRRGARVLCQPCPGRPETCTSLFQLFEIYNFEDYGLFGLWTLEFSLSSRSR